MSGPSPIPTPFGSWKKGPFHLGPWVLLALVSRNDRFLMFEAKDRAMDRRVFLVFSWEGEPALLDLHQAWGKFSGPPLPRVLQLAKVDGPEGESLSCLVLEGMQGVAFPPRLKRARWIELGQTLCLAMQELLDSGLGYSEFSSQDLRMDREGEVLLLPPFPSSGAQKGGGLSQHSGRRAVRSIAGLLLQGLKGSKQRDLGEQGRDLKGLPADLRLVLRNCFRGEAGTRYANPRQLGWELGRILRHEPVPNPGRNLRKGLERILGAILLVAVLLLFAQGALRLLQARSQALSLEAQRIENFGLLLGDFRAGLEEGSFERAAKLLENLEAMKLRQGEKLLNQAKGDFQRKLREHFGELFLLAEAKPDLKRIRTLAQGLFFLRWGPSHLWPRPGKEFLQKIQKVRRQAEHASHFLQSFTSLPTFLEGQTLRRVMSPDPLRKQFQRLCRDKPDCLPYAEQALMELRKGLDPRSSLLLLEVFLALPEDRRLEWLQQWLPEASTEEILFVCLSSAFRERERSLPILDKVLDVLEKRSSEVLQGRDLFGDEVHNRVSRALVTVYSAKETWPFWKKHYPLFEPLCFGYPRTLGSSLLLMRGILDPKGTEKRWHNWVRRGDLRVFFHPELCTDPRLQAEAEGLVRLCVRPASKSVSVPAYWSKPGFRNLAPFALLYFFSRSPQHFPLQDPQLRSLFWVKVFESFSEGGFTFRSFPIVKRFPEKDWALPLFRRFLRLNGDSHMALWQFYFQGEGRYLLLDCLVQKRAFPFLEDHLGEILESDRFPAQKFCLSLLLKARQAGLLSELWGPRLRSYLSRVASPYLRSLALGCLEEVGALEIQTFLELRSSSLPTVRKRAWTWLLEAGHLEKAWDILGGSEVPPKLLPPLGDLKMVETLFQRLAQTSARGGAAQGEGGPKEVPILSARRAHYFKALESLRNR